MVSDKHSFANKENFNISHDPILQDGTNYFMVEQDFTQERSFFILYVIFLAILDKEKMAEYAFIVYGRIKLQLGSFFFRGRGMSMVLCLERGKHTIIDT